jgi:undecaprenyl diphosphate synthase
VAIIMDGSGRWARGRGLPRSAGHRAGLATVRGIVEAAPGLGIGALTLFAFSADNWQRPPAEVANLMEIFREYLRAESSRLADLGIQVRVMGRRDRLPPALLEAVERIEAVTAAGSAMRLRLAIDYSGRWAILQAARRLRGAEAASVEEFGRLVEAASLGGGAPAMDLLIRTGGEQRLSDCLLWEMAYAELYFTPRMWPDFSVQDLQAALGEFYSRERRFGRISAGSVS